MQLIISFPEDKTEEWSLVEFQGTLETKHNTPYSSLHIGDLHFSGSTANLIIGHHLLTGQVTTLDPPLAVLKKGIQGSTGTEYSVVAMIKRKLVFKNRPKPLVSNPMHK